MGPRRSPARPCASQSRWQRRGDRMWMRHAETSTPGSGKRFDMSKEAKPSSVRIDQFFAGPGARADQWRALVDTASAWASGERKRREFEIAVADISVIEEFFAYPGPHLMAALR